jgi:chloramphenicol-sensitive protein RarD
LTRTPQTGNVLPLLTKPSPVATSPRGLLAATGCFVFWGLVAVYWKQLHHIGSFELVVHRTVWSLLFLAVMLWRRGRLPLVFAALRDRRLLLVNVLSGSLLMGNWLLFLYAVDHGELLEASLGYFLVPLFQVAAGYLFLHERPRRLQWLSILLAAAGVLWLLVGVGHVPWVALLLVGSWGPYGLVRKKSPMGALDGLAVEALLFTPLAIGYLVWLAWRGEGALGHVSAWETVLLLCSGWITAVPLVWFAYAAARIPISTLGLLQYIAPSLQFLLGWLVYHEPLDPAKLPGYAFIWLGLAIYSWEGMYTRRRIERAGRP